MINTSPDSVQKHTHRHLLESEVSPDPIQQFRQWFDEATAAQPHLPEAMTLATATKEGVPSARLVLLKSYDQHGFTFYTNFESRKGKDLAENPQACLVFWWPALERQVRIEGRIEKVSNSEADEYFQSRPRGSRLGAWASQQSSIIQSREELDRRYNELAEKYRDREVPRPPYWGGYRLLPTTIEFWQGRADRLHDRLCYIREGSAWRIDRLSP